MLNFIKTYAFAFALTLVAAFGLIVLGAGLGLVGPILIRDAIDGPLREAITSGVDESSASARSDTSLCVDSR